MDSGQAPVANDRKNKWRHIWLVVPALVVLAVGGSVYASSNREPTYDTSKAVFHEGHLYANFKPLGGVPNTSVYGKPVPYDTLWGPPTRAAQFTDDDGTTYGDCVGVGDKPVSFEPMLSRPYEALICHPTS